jgi:hypothetical protein
MSDERNNKPSASSMERYQLCPGSWAAEQGIPDQTSDDATTGNRIHAWLAGETMTVPLTSDEVDLALKCREQEETILNTVLPYRDEIVREHRYWMGQDVTGQEWSGKPDVVAIDSLSGDGVVIDYKTGRGEVTSAEGNLQLRALAVLVGIHHGLTKVTVAIVQPLAGAPTLCEYSFEDLIVARAEVGRIVDRINSPNAPRIPSPDACKYCKAKPYCVEAREQSVALPVTAIPAGTTPDAIAATLTSQTLAEFLERAEFAVRVIDACKAEAKRRLEHGDQVPGWTLKPGSERETITDATTVYNRTAALGVNAEAFMSCVSIAKGKLKDAVKAATSEKGKALDARLESILAGCTETKATAPSLVRLSS